MSLQVHHSLKFLFCGCAEEDRPYLQELEKHLAPLVSMGLIQRWSNSQVEPGQNAKAEIERNLDAADLIVLLVSADLLASSFWTSLVQRALARNATGEAVVLPVLVRAAELAGLEISQLVLLPRNRRPVASWADRDEAWSDVVNAVRAMADGSANNTQETLALHLPQRVRNLIHSKTDDFVGREHVFTALAEFVDAQRSGYFTLLGDPGMGKSAILAEYVRRTGSVVHFNSCSDGVNGTAQFLESLGGQLRDRYGVRAPLASAAPHEQGTVLYRLLEEAAARVYPEKLVVGIDALDEVEKTSDIHANVLLLPRVLPRGIFCFVTSRPDKLRLRVEVPQHCLDLGHFPKENRRDARRYLEARVRREALQNWLRIHGTSAADLIDALVEKSEGNFMYLWYVLSDLELARAKDLVLNNLPLGLVGYYEDHWRRMGMEAEPLPREKIKILKVLAQLPRPEPLAFIVTSSGEDPVLVQKVLTAWDPFLHEQPRDGAICYSIYHASFRDFLRDSPLIKAAGMTTEHVNQLMARNVLDSLL